MIISNDTTKRVLFVNTENFKGRHDGLFYSTICSWLKTPSKVKIARFADWFNKTFRLFALNNEKKKKNR